MNVSRIELQEGLADLDPETLSDFSLINTTLCRLA